MKRYTVVQRHKSRGIRTWYGRVFDTDTGSVKYVSLGVDRKKDALEWRDRMISEQLSGKSSRTVAVTVDTAVNSYLKSLDGSSITFANYRSALQYMAEWFTENGISLLAEITPIAVSNFFSGIDGWKATTRKKRLSIYRTWAKWCMEVYEPEWKRNPFSSVKINGARQKPKDFWTIEQVEAIIAAASEFADLRKRSRPELALMYAFMAFAGLRFNECRKMTLDDIFDDDGNVRENLRVDGKGGKVAFVPICSRLREQIISTFQNTQILKKNTQFLEFWRAAKGKKLHLFTSTNGNQNRLLKTLFSKNPILASFGGEVHLHRFRHSFISNLIRANCCSIRCVADLARHENPTITLNAYAHLLPSDKREALEIFSTNRNQGGSK